MYEGHPHLLAEMYAYSVSAAHLELPHLRLDTYMTSDVDSYGEAWPYVDQLPVDHMCTHDLSTSTDKLPVRRMPLWSRRNDKGTYLTINQRCCVFSLSVLQFLLHYCQRYKVGKEHNFWKRDIPHDIFSCQSQPIELPDQKDINRLFLNKTLTKGMSMKDCGGLSTTKQPQHTLDMAPPFLALHPAEERYGLYHAFQYCQISIKLNKALIRYKSIFCNYQSQG